ncbi:EscI/YscI/HrpB family type III secretion system inner rod protein [Phaeobacter sp. HF9A]|uniref:EscI/YscI/HrpB family type III secretion system inner rod protein n=1 Tax=Phaeobacter sp. HF9A TaxID=2721561 RepID=UPI00142F8495|nr:EscI/YscI/HrpB family type III secretion system inner rod protein [Phaeobacter sp. HF9A]NIZ12011.1 hypothetical protein [Phaeobacter sp. HF9A]
MTAASELGRTLLTGLQPGSNTAEAVGNAAKGDSMGRFETAMRDALTGRDTAALSGAEPVRLAQVGPLTELPASTGQIRPVGAQEFNPLSAAQAPQQVSQGRAADDRAASGLGLAGPEVGSVEATPGQTILSGLERMRSVFDDKIGGIGNRMEHTEMSVQAMVSLQAEVVEYSVLVDVSSKLAGKSTQAMDSLMKGQ